MKYLYRFGGLFLIMMLAACDRGGGADNGDTNITQHDSVPEQIRQTGGQWQLVWADEFDQAQLDSNRWSYEKNCWGGGNNELQCYTDDPDNVFLHNGWLHIKAIQEQISGDSGQNGDSGTLVTRDYSSGRIRTLGKGDWKYGRIEVRARLPYGQGLWPAIWMLPSDWLYGSWAASGEIDIMEAINLKTGGVTDNTIHGTLHFGGSWPDNTHTGNTYKPASDVTERFHVYAIEWVKGEIRWYVDDHWYASLDQSDWYTGGTAADPGKASDAAPFDQPFHLILNVAVGGNWPGSPDAQTVFPQQMLVDYVRVYQCSADPDTGWGCATLDGSPDIDS